MRKATLGSNLVHEVLGRTYVRAAKSHRPVVERLSISLWMHVREFVNQNCTGPERRRVDTIVVDVGKISEVESDLFRRAIRLCKITGLPFFAVTLYVAVAAMAESRNTVAVAEAFLP